MANIFSQVAGLRPRRSVFNLSYAKKMTIPFSQLIPVMCDEVVPGDKFQIAYSAVLRFMPLVAPILHNVRLVVHYFFVPYRLLWDGWENFITRGKAGNDNSSVPRWKPTTVTETGVGSMWDYFGFPTDIDASGAAVDGALLPLDFPRRAYNLVYNEYYRDEDIDIEQPLNSSNLRSSRYKKDYFTSARPFQQRGQAPALPIYGTGNAEFQNNIQLAYLNYTGAYINQQIYPNQSGNQQAYYIYPNGIPSAWAAPTGYGSVNGISPPPVGGYGTPVGVKQADLNNNTVDLENATSVNISDLRVAVQLQKFMERNARGGIRYKEFIELHYGVKLRDERVQRPEYIGGASSPVVVSEVLQTSKTDGSPQGNMAGHGINAVGSMIGSYFAPEYGLILGLASVRFDAAYEDGINRQWLRESPYDWYFPEFANLSEQGILEAELRWRFNASDSTIFGFQGRYDEMRVKNDMVCADMRLSAPNSLGYWHLGRHWDASLTPQLNPTFIAIPKSGADRIFAVVMDRPLMLNYQNIIKAVRPIPIMSDPGLMDHH